MINKLPPTYKILIVNYRYFLSGGPERYLFNLTNLLSDQGYDILPFSVNYSKNVDSPYSKYFVEPIAGRDEVYFDQHKRSFKGLSRTISRLFYSQEVERAICHLIDEEQPKIAYILHYLRKLSPALLIGLKKKGIPIVVRLSDYAMLCPQAHCLRDETPCTLCVKGDLFPSIRHKCIKGSLPASLLNALATWYHRVKCYFDLIDVFICTNQFMYRMMAEAGYPEKRLYCIPTFTDIDHFRPDDDYAKSGYVVYSGRLNHLKGLHVLLDAFAYLIEKGINDVKLKIAGTGDKEYIKQCKEKVRGKGLELNVEFLGNIDSAQLPTLLSRAIFSVMPSLWFENLPNTILESYACGTPVVASDIGSLSDCVNNYHTGFLFKPGDSEDLAGKMEYCFSNSDLLKKMAVNARSEAEIKYSPSKHVNSLLHLFERLL